MRTNARRICDGDISNYFNCSSHAVSQTAYEMHIRCTFLSNSSTLKKLLCGRQFFSCEHCRSPLGFVSYRNSEFIEKCRRYTGTLNALRSHQRIFMTLVIVSVLLDKYIYWCKQLATKLEKIKDTVFRTYTLKTISTVSCYRGGRYVLAFVAAQPTREGDVTFNFTRASTFQHTAYVKGARVNVNNGVSTRSQLA